MIVCFYIDVDFESARADSTFCTSVYQEGFIAQRFYKFVGLEYH